MITTDVVTESINKLKKEPGAEEGEVEEEATMSPNNEAETEAEAEAEAKSEANSHRSPSPKVKSPPDSFTESRSPPSLLPEASPPRFSPGITSAFSPVVCPPNPMQLFQPFLTGSPPTATTSSTSSSPLPFSIDNILKPTFGQRLQLLQHMAASLAAQRHQHFQSQISNAIKKEVSASPPLSSTSSTASSALGSTSNLASVNSQRSHHHHHSNNNNNNQPVDLSAKQDAKSGKGEDKKDADVPPGMVRGPNGQLWPAWVFCTRYSDRPSSGPRSRKVKKPASTKSESSLGGEKRPRTAFSSEQLSRLKKEFEENRYLTEERRKNLADDLGLNENQIKIWFQNKRAKLKKSSGQKGELAQMLAAQGLYNHSTIPVDEDENPIVY